MARKSKNSEKDRQRSPGPRALAPRKSGTPRTARSAERKVAEQNLWYSFLRPDDLLALTFEFENLRLVPRGHRKGPKLKVIDRGQQARIIVQFPGQHIGEQVFREAQTEEQSDDLPLPPIAARLAEPSRLVFALPGGVAEVPFSLEALLDWNALLPSLRDAPLGPPADHDSAIEVPYRLILSPGTATRWEHAREPVVHDGLTELWHTRLGSVDRSRPAELFALWSPDYQEPAPEDEMPFRTSLTPEQRSAIVEQAQDADGDHRPLVARHLMLSSLGAIVDLEGVWPSGSLAKWTHRAALGRDQHVLVEMRGHLFPFGHAATLVQITERKLNHVGGSAAPAGARGAYLRKRQFIVIKEPVRDYDRWHMAFRSLRFEDLVTPPLDWNREADGTFWPSVCGEPFAFRFAAGDWVGAECHLSAPVIFVPDDKDQDSEVMARVAETYRNAEAHRQRGMGGQSVAIARSGQQARSGGGSQSEGDEDTSESFGDTSLEVVTVSFLGELEAEPEPDSPGPSFRPITDGVEARVPSLKNFLDDADNQGWFTLHDLAAPDNRGEIFAITEEGTQVPLALDRQSDRSGGVAAPSMEVRGLSRTHGPVGDPRPMLSQGFDPEAYFATTAKLLGQFQLADLFPKVEASGETPGLPKIELKITIKEEKKKNGKKQARARGSKQSDDEDPEKSETAIEVELKVGWETGELQNWPAGAPIFVAQPDGTGVDPFFKTQLNQAGLEISGSIKSNVRKMDKASLTMTGALKDFGLQLVFGGNGVGIAFESVAYSATNDTPPDFDVKIAKVEFIGEYLSFIRTLQSLLQGPDQGDDEKAKKKKKDNDPGGVTVTVGPFALPSITMGIFTMEQLTLTNSVMISFGPKPVSFGFQFSRKDKPFLMTVGPYGGSGYFGLTVDTEGLQMLEASFQFGANRDVSLAGGIVAGKVFVFGGIYFQSKKKEAGTEITLSAFIHAGGTLTAFELITVTLDIQLTLTVKTLEGNAVLTGTVEVKIGVKILFFSASVTLLYEQTLAGSEAEETVARLRGRRPRAAKGPSFKDVMTKSDWRAYNLAFAG